MLCYLSELASFQGQLSAVGLRDLGAFVCLIGFWSSIDDF